MESKLGQNGKKERKRNIGRVKGKTKSWISLYLGEWMGTFKMLEIYPVAITDFTSINPTHVDWFWSVL